MRSLTARRELGKLAEWVPPPRYLLRKHCVLALLRGLAPCRALEIGCGAGDMLATLAERGYTGVGLELSADAGDLARRALAPYGDRVTVRIGDYREVSERFGLVLALDVLEHIEHDEEALSCWARLVEPGGRLLLSVPAHTRRWDWSDVAVGHYRRYDKADLAALVHRCGLSIEELWCYGFPLSNVVAWAANRTIYARRTRVPEPMLDRTGRSGLLESSDARLLRFLALQLWVPAFARLQMLFARRNLGTGYVLSARRVPGVEDAGVPGRCVASDLR